MVYKPTALPLSYKREVPSMGIEPTTYSLLGGYKTGALPLSYEGVIPSGGRTHDFPLRRRVHYPLCYGNGA
jgi:hypothetical protein